MQKRGQITVFIIIGILMLFIFAGILYVSKMVVKEEITSEGEPIIEEVPLEFAAIKAFTENCLYSVGKKGLLILGQQGGHIYPELLGEFSVSKPTDSVGINLEPTKVPYWHYNVEPNKGDKIVFSSLQPELHYEDDPEFSIEAQLGRFADERLDNCLEDYAAFEKQGFEIEKGEIKTEVTVGENTVNFWLKMPLEAEKGEAEGSMDQFYVKIPLDLKHYYEVADTISGAEKNFSFLERQGLDLISIFSMVDMEKLPPTSMTTFEMAPTAFWNELSVKENMKRVLSSYVPMLRFLGSENFYDYIYPESAFSDLYQATYDQMVLSLRGAEDLEVSFDYFGWEPYFKTNSKDGMINPYHTFVNYKVFNFGMQRYDTRYDVSYPVLIILRDKSAFHGQGYVFSFALEANIRNNEPVVSDQIKEVYPARISDMACDKGQWDTGVLRTVVVDSFTKEPIEMVKVGFTIPEQGECEMGFTDSGGTVESKYPAVYGGIMNFIKEDYLINFYPIDTYRYEGEPGIIGYAVEEYPEEVVEMHKYKKINISVKKKNLEKCLVPLVCEYTAGAYGLALTAPIPFTDISCEKGNEQCFFDKGLFGLPEPIASLEANGSVSKHNDYYFTDSVKELSDEESAMIVLKRVSDLNPEIMSNEFSVAVNLEGDGIEEVELVPGVYELSGNIFLNEEMSIAEEVRCMSYDIMTWEEEECFTINGTNMEKFMEGTMEWNTPATYFKITPEELYTSDNLVVYLLSQNLKNVPVKTKGVSKECAGYSCLPVVGCLFEACDSKDIEINGRVVEDLQLVGQMAKISRMPDVRTALEPRFS